MKLKSIITCICIVFIILIAFYGSSDLTYTKIKNGFSNDLVSMIKEKYHVTIPKEAVFIEGYYDGFQDPYVSVKFKIPKDLCDTLYDDSWKEGCIDSFSNGNDGIERVMEYKDKPYTYLGYYHESDDGTVEVHFRGQKPGDPIK